MSKDAKDANDGQADRTERSLEEASRSALAIEDLAKATKANAELMQAALAKQMRAYVTVQTGVGIPQSEALRFEYDPVVLNAGLTPARNVSYRITADVLPAALPDDFEFRHYGSERKNDALLANRQSFDICGVVHRRFPENEVPEIMAGRERRLYVWGEVTYDDIYGGSWMTRFCHGVIFDRTGPGPTEINVRVLYHPSHNDAT